MSDNLANYRRWDAITAPRVREHEVIDLRDDAPTPVASPEALLAAQLHGLPAGPTAAEDSGDDVIDLRDEASTPDLAPIAPDGIDGEWERMSRAVQTSLAARAAAKLDAGHVPLGMHFDTRS